MRTRAAVATEAGKPLEIMDVNLDGPRAGEVLVEIKATGICHTDEFTLSGGDPEGLFPAILGHEGAGVVLEVGAGVTSLAPGDHVIPLYTAECRECEYCLHPKTNLCQKVRGTQGQGVMPDGTSRFSTLDGDPILHYMGCSTFSNHTVLPEISLAKVRSDAPFDKICYIGCGVTTGIGAVIYTAKVEIGARAIVFGLGGIGLNVIQGLRLAGADQIVGVDINPAKKEMAERFGMTDFVNPKEVEGDLVPYLVDLTKGGADYTFDATGNVDVMRAALESAHKGWGESIIIGVAPAGAEISTRPFQLVTGRSWRGTAFGGARGRTDVPQIVDWYMDGKIDIDPMITHQLKLDEINKGFDLMHAGESIRSVVVYWDLLAARRRVTPAPRNRSRQSRAAVAPRGREAVARTGRHRISPSPRRSGIAPLTPDPAPFRPLSITKRRPVQTVGACLPTIPARSMPMPQRSLVFWLGGSRSRRLRRHAAPAELSHTSGLWDASGVPGPAGVRSGRLKLAARGPEIWSPDRPGTAISPLQPWPTCWPPRIAERLPATGWMHLARRMSRAARDRGGVPGPACRRPPAHSPGAVCAAPIMRPAFVADRRGRRRARSSGCRTVRRSALHALPPGRAACACHRRTGCACRFRR